MVIKFAAFKIFFKSHFITVTSRIAVLKPIEIIRRQMKIFLIAVPKELHQSKFHHHLINYLPDVHLLSPLAGFPNSIKIVSLSSGASRLTLS